MRLIDAEALAKAMYHEAFETDSDMQKWDSGCWIRFRMFETHLANAPTIPQWIPCSERLPEEIERVYWICTDDGYQCQCRWTNVHQIITHLETDWHWHHLDKPQRSKVVAWQLLPEPYRKESE